MAVSDKTMQYTPGPWHVKPGEPWIDGISYTCNIIDDSGEPNCVIAEVYGDTPEEAKANARLIVGVHDLLNLARWVEKFAVDPCLDDGSSDCDCLPCVGIIARAAIDRATDG
jgi:hypothetical protein